MSMPQPMDPNPLAKRSLINLRYIPLLENAMKIIAHIPDVESGDVLIEKMLDEWSEPLSPCGLPRPVIIKQKNEEDEEECR